MTKQQLIKLIENERIYDVLKNSKRDTEYIRGYNHALDDIKQRITNKTNKTNEIFKTIETIKTI